MRVLVVLEVSAAKVAVVVAVDQTLVRLAEQVEKLAEMLVGQVIRLTTTLPIRTAELAVLLDIVQVEMAAGAVMQVTTHPEVIFKVAAVVAVAQVAQHQIVGQDKRELLVLQVQVVMLDRLE
jgi:hypothetical protein